MSGQIRAVVIDDAPAIHAIYAPYVAETVISFELSPPTVAEMAARIKKTVGKFPWLVYVPDGSAEVVGYAYASAHRERAAYQWSVDVSVYVSPQHQRRNIGRGLYTALFELLRAQGFVNAYAGIALPNAGSVGVHEAVGFVPLGVYREVGYKLGDWHDVGWWSLRLGEPVAAPQPPKPITDFADTPLWASAMQQGLALINAKSGSNG